ncbi:DNA recombination protein RmuC [Croceicoccus naphthovorans]|uniref:DNA recombination protein RmuC homolog n=1 Tax=Croceicoccus naphthovorans TaxID=1348774 RepID=A0A0G3XDI7_9SPHN|nr:DNA recombination protein RmuC [Croceicoccus naphthovorans]AKM09252.1 DNA recombinase [Croceicoccus naphthovorans]MBB3990359.1 DNA recombination protein RmuC [Croceicoccus naphthovorans]
MDILALVFAVVALVVGLVAGWFFGSRPVADWRARHSGVEADLKEKDEKFRAAIAELATMSERADRAGAIEDQLRESRAQVEALRVSVAELNKDRANLAEREVLLKEAREELGKQFEAMGNKALEGAQARFLERANERFSESEKTNAARIKALLEPVGSRLKAYEEQVAALEEKRVKDFGSLAGVIEQMRLGQEEVRREAQRLGNSLTNAPKARGRWGERALQNVLEQCGLAEHTDFHLEHSMDTSEGRLRPDAIVNVPGQKKLVIDAKVSLNAYQAAFEAEDGEERQRHMDLHARSMRNHVQTLGSKGYQSQFEDAPDYVVMFVPGEHFVAAALEHDPELWDFAFRNKVLLATPTNLVAIARTVAQVWRQDTIAREAVAIGKAGSELYDRLAVAAEHLKRVGGGLETAVNNYNKFVGSFERNVLSSGKRLAEKGIEIGKREIEDVPLVEAAPRYGSDDTAAGEPKDVARLSISDDQTETRKTG